MQMQWWSDADAVVEVFAAENAEPLKIPSVKPGMVRI